jgi:hypothetical protein
MRIQISDGQGTLQFDDPITGLVDAPWILVTHAMSPYNANPGEVKFKVDSTLGQVLINIPAASYNDKAIFMVKDWKGQSGVNPIVVVPPSGTIENPANPGNQAAQASCTSQGGAWWWQVDLADGQMLWIASA